MRLTFSHIPVTFIYYVFTQQRNISEIYYPLGFSIAIPPTKP